jgi:hypothetical protein
MLLSSSSSPRALISRSEIKTLRIEKNDPEGSLRVLDCKRLQSLEFAAGACLYHLEIRWCHGLTLVLKDLLEAGGDRVKHLELESVLLLEKGGEELLEPLGSSSPFLLNVRDCRGTLNLSELPGLESLSVTFSLPVERRFPFVLKGESRTLRNLKISGERGGKRGGKEERGLSLFSCPVVECLGLESFSMSSVEKLVAKAPMLRELTLFDLKAEPLEEEREGGEGEKGEGAELLSSLLIFSSTLKSSVAFLKAKRIELNDCTLEGEGEWLFSFGEGVETVILRKCRGSGLRILDGVPLSLTLDNCCRLERICLEGKRMFKSLSLIRGTKEEEEEAKLLEAPRSSASSSLLNSVLDQELLVPGVGRLTLNGLGAVQLTEKAYQYVVNSGVSIYLEDTYWERPGALPWGLRRLRGEERGEEEREEKRVKREEGEEEGEEEPLCVVCLEEASLLFLCPYNCKSTVVCEDCVNRLNNRCPTCRWYTKERSEASSFSF